MTIIEYSPTKENILDCIEDGIRNLKASDSEARFIVCGPVAHDMLCDAVAERFGRDKKSFETYSHLPVVIDPFRDNTVSVLPAPRAFDGPVETVRV